MEGAALLERLGWQLGEVVEIVFETPEARSFRIALPDWPGHRAGQHVDIRLTAPDGYQAVRSYSISSPPEEPLVEVTVERLKEGEVSPFLVEEVRVGDRLEFRGPIGGYFIWRIEDGGPLMLIAGGSGIVPLMSMMRHRAAHHDRVPTRLLYSVRTPAGIFYRGDLNTLSAVGTGLEITYTYTRMSPPGWKGYTRRIDDAMLQETVFPASGRPRIYVCGSTNFVESVAGSLVRLGYPPERIKTERFGPTGTP